MLKMFKNFYVQNRQKVSYKTVEGTEVLTYNKKLYVPINLRKKVLQWYHHYLCHPGTTWLVQTLWQTMVWPGISGDCEKFTKTCEKFQCYKKTSTKYGKLPGKYLRMNTFWCFMYRYSRSVLKIN